MIKRLINIRHIVQVALSFVLVTLVSSCQEEFARLIPEQDFNQDTVDVAFGTPRVLYLIVDGARGESVRTAGAVTINGLLNQSIYSWVSLSDETVTEPGTNWADMLTGVKKEKHGVIGNNFDNQNFENFPLIFDRIKAVRPESDIRVFTPSTVFNDNFTDAVDASEVLSNDEAVKNAVVSNLADEDITILLGHFTSIDEAGAQNGYDNSVAAYKSAILKFDDYVKDMIAALKARPTYSEENWLVVIASSKGGHFEIPEGQNDNTIFSNPDVNTFTIFHAPKYSARFIGKPYLGNRFQGEFFKFQGNRYAEVTAGDNSQYNLGDEAFTIELKVKRDRALSGQYPSLLGKRPRWAWDQTGWVVFLENDFWMFNAKGTGNNGAQLRGGALADATWNTISVVGVIRDGQRYVRTFTNGNFYTEQNIQGWGNLNNDAILKMGFIEGNTGLDAYIADVRIWKVALPDDVVKEYACEVGVDENHPYFNFLAGYWPVVGNEGNTIRDEGILGSHMTIRGNNIEENWQRLADFMCAPSTDDLGSLVPRNVDVPAQIITWLKIARQESWQFDGRVWLDR